MPFARIMAHPGSHRPSVQTIHYADADTDGTLAPLCGQKLQAGSRWERENYREARRPVCRRCDQRRWAWVKVEVETDDDGTDANRDNDALSAELAEVAEGLASAMSGCTRRRKR